MGVFDKFLDIMKLNDDDYDDENDDIDAETAHLMEINRRKNEEALGL